MDRELHIGSACREWSIGEFRFGCWATNEFGSRVPEHEHEQAHIMFACSGDYRSRVAGAERARHRILFNPAGTVHDDRFESPGLFFSINFVSTAGGLWGDRAPSVPSLADSPRARSIVQRLIRTAPSPSQQPHQTEYLIAELMTEFVPERAPPRTPEWMAKVIEALHERLPVPRVAELAAVAGVHPYHLASVFRRAHGCTPADYARSLRLSAALDELRNPHADLAQVAEEHGFADQSHLTRAVSAMFGVGPSELRRRLN